jgi:hypothetical protein
MGWGSLAAECALMALAGSGEEAEEEEAGDKEGKGRGRNGGSGSVLFWTIGVVLEKIGSHRRPSAPTN